MDFPLPKKNKHLIHTPKINILHTFFAIYTVKKMLRCIPHHHHLDKSVQDLFYRHIMIYSKIECLNNCIVLSNTKPSCSSQHCTFFSLKKILSLKKDFMWGFKKSPVCYFLHISWKLTWHILDSCCSFTKIQDYSGSGLEFSSESPCMPWLDYIPLIGLV